jgi:glycerol-3-phosphate dehydrogenase
MDQRPVVILGGGINGAAAARELALSGASIWLVDTSDLAFGATAYSSRLIHGGLRYLEFAEFSLVRESLDERARLLRLAPHLVTPLRLFIPVRNSWGGLTQAAGKFLGLPSRSNKTVHRGLRVVQVGLWLYDRYSKKGGLPPRSLHAPGNPGVPAVSREIARRLWAYSDAQIIYPERLVIDFLHDAKQLAKQRGADFRVFTYSRATLHNHTLEIRPVDDADSSPIATVEPAAIINATGAWVDETLAKLPVPSRRLMGGTKGSHFVTYQSRLKELLAGQGVYTEARDGRPVFLLPFREGTLVGTTDIPFEGDPAMAVATEQELEYLIAVVNDVFPDAQLDRSDITMHQCGVRPLPFVDAKTPAAITRRHQLVWNDSSPVPLVSLVGGKLTTCRSLAEETAAAVFGRLNRKVETTSRDRPIPESPVEVALREPRLVANEDEPCLAGTQIPQAIALTCIDDEFATCLEDLVERRLMLHFSPHLSHQTLADLAQMLVQAGRLTTTDIPTAIARCEQRLRSHFGIQLATDH